jgi:hypothetical protein
MLKRLAVRPGAVLWRRLVSTAPIVLGVMRKGGTSQVGTLVGMESGELLRSRV